MDYTLLSPYSDAVLFFARLVAGIIFIYYGWPKIKDLKKNAEEFVEKGFKPGWFWGTPFALVEFFGGIGLILGVYVFVWAILFSVMMIVGTVWKIQNPEKNFGNWSYDLTLLAIMLTLLVTGPGEYTLL